MCPRLCRPHYKVGNQLASKVGKVDGLVYWANLLDPIGRLYYLAC